MRIAVAWACLLLLAACGSDESTEDDGGTGASGGSTSSANGTGGSGGATGAGGGMSGPSCGGMMPGCDFGQICVAFHATAGPTTNTSYECHPNPCVPNSVDCSCAGSICSEKFGVELCSAGSADVDLNCDNGAD